ncbi:MAG: hypothetical protein GY796_17715 [Chloroflexi bacterium]|nr:hypothetical protein [Chloroflexota bacterium]
MDGKVLVDPHRHSQPPRPRHPVLGYGRHITQPPPGEAVRWNGEGYLLIWPAWAGNMILEVYDDEQTIWFIDKYGSRFPGGGGYGGSSAR